MSFLNTGRHFEQGKGRSTIFLLQLVRKHKQLKLNHCTASLPKDTHTYESYTKYFYIAVYLNLMYIL